ncbi:MAG TPA: M28 family metallopeptidase [Thermoanaerobaculia bacterium]|nr:M28 family metallopeptidase [Thermoanaerobaculia bacterium]
MKIWTQTVPHEPAARAAAESMPLKPGVWSLRFGAERLLFSEEAAPAAASRGARIPSRDEDVAREQLHVVVQNGRLFQQHHPEVSVLHDRGRFLLVRLDPEQAKTLAREAPTCFGVMPAADDQVIFDERPAERARAAVPPFVQALVDSVSRASLQTNLNALVAFQTRHSLSAGFTNASAAARTQLANLGYSTKFQSVTVNGKPSRNVIADKAGAGAGKRKVFLATAHLDSINLAGGAAAPAPGADDNGTGSAGVLEIARVFASHRAVHDLRLILFGGEEEGLFGSRKYVSSLSAAERARIGAVVNMDMIGSVNSPSPGVLLEGAALSQSAIDGLAAAAAAFTTLKVQTSLHPFNSDHVPFIDRNIPAVLTIEGADDTNDRIHSARDTLDGVNADLMLAIVRMNVGFLAAMLGSV